MSFWDALDALVHDGAAVFGFLAALVIVLALTPFVGRFAVRIGAIDRGGDRPRVHQVPVPRIGGLAMVAGILVPALLFIDLDGPLLGVVIGIPLIAAVGLADDLHGLTPSIKLAAVLAVALIPVAGFDMHVGQLGLPFLGIIDFGWAAYPLTVVWIALVANLINLVDGMDALAAGIVAIATLTFAILAVSFGRVEVAAMSAMVCGATLGFLRHNAHPAKIFMGDTGALTLGFVVGSLAVDGVLKGAATIALAAPLLALAVPLLDTSFVVLKRLRYRRPPFGADQNHFYHRFLRIGYSQRRTAAYLHAWAALLSAYALLLRFVPPRPGGDWDLGHTVICAIAGVVVVAVSVWMVYTLEILKARHLQALGLPVPVPELEPEDSESPPTPPPPRLPAGTA